MPEVYIPIRPAELDRRLWGGVGFHLDSFWSVIPGGKRERLLGEKGKRESGLPQNFTWISLGKGTARTHARTTRNDFPVGLTPQPPIRFQVSDFRSRISDFRFQISDAGGNRAPEAGGTAGRQLGEPGRAFYRTRLLRNCVRTL